MAAALAITSGLLVAIIQAGFVLHTPARSQPLVVDLIPLPPPAPPPPSLPDTPMTVRLPKQIEPVEAATPALSAIVPAPVVAETAPAARPVTISPVPAPEPPPPTISATPAVRTADLSVRLLSAPQPRYPIDARRRREQGDVVLSVLLGTDGRVQDISVSRSSGSDRLDEAALAAVRRWRWSPMMVAGVPVMVRGVVTIPFVLQG